MSVQGHTPVEYDNDPSIIVHANVVYSFNPPPWNNSYPTPTIKDGRATLTLYTSTLPLNTRVLCNGLGSSAEHPTIHLLHLHNPNPTWRVLWSAS